MGYWEQIGEDNAKERERRAQRPAWRERLSDYIDMGLVALPWIALAIGAYWIWR